VPDWLRWLEAPIPKPLLRIGTPIAAFVLVTLFVFLRFPFGDLAPFLAQQIAALTGAEVSIGDLEPRLTIGGPGFAARDVRLVTPGRRRFDVDPLRVRPAWSTSWLRGDPALRVDAESAVGRAGGVIVLGDAPAFRGEFVDVDLASLPIAAAGTEGLALSGRLTGAADLALAAGAAVGPLSFDVRSGAIVHPLLPVPIEFETIRADLVLGGAASIDVKSFALDGPIVNARLTGTLGVAGAPAGRDGPLDLDVELEIPSPPLRALLEGVGLRTDGRGHAAFAISGTLAQPRFQ
jgi:type II secretion system protein N